MTPVREEIFGPVVVVVPFDDEDEAIADRQRQRLRPLQLRVHRRHRPGVGRRQAPALGQRRHQLAAAQPRGAVRRLQAVGRRPRRRLASGCTPTASCSPSSGRAEPSHLRASPTRNGVPMKGIVYDGTTTEVVDRLEVRDLRAGEVRVKIEAAGRLPQRRVGDRRHDHVPDAGGVGPRGRRHRHRRRRRRHPRDSPATTSCCRRSATAATAPRATGASPRSVAPRSGKLTRPFTLGDQKCFQFANTSVFVEETVVKGT